MACMSIDPSRLCNMSLEHSKEHAPLYSPEAYPVSTTCMVSVVDLKKSRSLGLSPRSHTDMIPCTIYNIALALARPTTEERRDGTRASRPTNASTAPATASPPRALAR
eukprot:scaffold76165_cov38-Tisochrysis_lutea.AAC.8